MMTKLSILAVSFAALAGCASDGGEDIAMTTLAGQVGGQPWSFVAGNTDAFLSEGEDDFFATLYAEQFTPCDFEPTGPHLIVAIPKTPGDYEMSLSRNMTFVADNDNKISIEGRLVVDTVTADKITGGLVSSYDDGNQVNGMFELTVCPPDNQ